jgi:glycosyltransferase involved in cell wall biosynthesis
MIIGIDGNEANVENRVGISEYAYWLLYYFEKFAVAGDFGRTNFQVYLKNNPVSGLPDQNKYWRYKHFGPGKFWTQFALPLNLYLQNPKPNIFFSPTHYAPRFSPVPTVVSVMDLSYLYFPELFNKTDLYQLRNWTEYSVKKAARVLTISNSSRSDIIKEYKIPEENVVTIYPGIKEPVTLEPHVYGMNQLQSKYSISKNYILFVGTLQPRKNISRLIEAFSLIKKQEARSKKQGLPEDLQLVIVGKKGWLYEEILGAPEKFEVKNSVLFLDSITDEELPEFYKNALCYILPSLYEGFGLPVLEAMKYGCPVITSNVSSMPEAGGEAAVYVNPESAKDISEKIFKVISDPELRHEMKTKGKEQVKKFNWEKTARETMRVLQEVAGGK